MDKKLFHKPHFLLTIASIAIAAFIVVFNIFEPLPASFIVPPPPIDPGDIRISTVAEDNLGGIVEADVFVECDGGSGWGFLGKTDENGVILFDAGVVLGDGGEGTDTGSEGGGEVSVGPVNIPAEADCQNNENINIKIFKTGYVTRTSMGENIYLEAEGNNYTISDIQFSHKINLTREIDNSAISEAIITAGANHVSCSEGDTLGSYYCPVGVDDDGNPEDIVISSDGYVIDRNYDTLKRESDEDPQSVVDISSIKFAYKITGVYAEGSLQENITDSVTGLELGDETGYDSCALIEGAWYCPVKLANSDGTIIGRVTKEAYVQSQYAVNNGTNRVANSDAQVEDTVTGVKYAMAVTVTNRSNNEPINNASVKVGDDLAITCSINGNSGVYSCALPTSHSANLLRVSANNYVVKEGDYTLRNSQDSTQIEVTMQLDPIIAEEVAPVEAADPNENTLPTHLRKEKQDQALVADTDTGPVAVEDPVIEQIEIKEEELVAESKVLTETAPEKLPEVLSSTAPKTIGSVVKDIIKKVEDIITPSSKEAATPPSAPAAFIEYGTTLTAKIGVGERAGVISSFEKVYGKAPATQEDWQDVIKIANGRFPSKTVIEKEKVSSEAFSKVYLREPDLSKEKEKAAITIMTYGVRPVNRSLLSEARAIVTFRSVFDRLPSSTADWDIIRGIAYSGVSR